MAFQQLTLSQVSLVKTPSGITEMYIPLWVYGSSYAGATTNSNNNGLAKGTTSQYSLSTSGPVQCKLHTLNANWSPNQKFAFEASIWCGGSGSCTAGLYDFTAGGIVSGSTVSVPSSVSTPTLVRSGQFTLVPGRTYGVVFYSSTSGQYVYLTKAHLIAFLSQ